MNNKLRNIGKNKYLPTEIIKIFLFFFILKSILSYFVIYPFTIDTYEIIKMSKSFFESGTFAMAGHPTHHYPPLYSMLISISYLLKNYSHIYFSMQIINSFLTSLVIIPAFLISRNFMDKNNSIIISIIIVFLPLNFYYPIRFILTEQLFSILFLLMFYFLHKSITQDSLKQQLLAGFLLGLCLLTRYISFAIFPAIILALLIRQLYYSNYKAPMNIIREFIKSVLHYLPFFTIAFATFAPWMIRNGLQFGFTVKGMMGYTSEISSVGESIYGGMPFFSRLFIELFAHVGVLVYASGVIFFVMSLFLIRNMIKNKKYESSLSDFIILSFSIMFMYIVLSSYHNAMLVSISHIRILPRYIEVALPLVYIIGYLGLMEYQQSISKSTSKLTPYFLVSLLSMMFLLPVPEMNDLSMCTIGILYRLNYLDILLGTSTISSFISPHIALIKLLVFVILTSGWFVLYKKKLLKLKYVSYLIMLMLLATNAVGYMGSFPQKVEYSTEIGEWYNSHAPTTPEIVLFDERDVNLYFFPGGPSKMGFWINAPIRIGNATSPEKNVEYIVSANILDLPVVATEKTHNMFVNGTEIPEKVIYLYKL